AFRDGERNAVDRLDVGDLAVEHAATDGKVFLQILRRHDRLSLAAAIACVAGRDRGLSLTLSRCGKVHGDLRRQARTSIAWRSPSATRLNDNEARKIAAPGKAQTSG